MFGGGKETQMHEWMDKWMYERMEDRWMNERMDGWMDQ